MKQVVTFESKYGPVLVGVDQAAVGPAPASLGDILKRAKSADISLEDALATIQPAALTLLDSVDNLGPRRPDSFAIEFGVKLGAGFAVIASATAEASITVTMTWSRPDAAET